MITYECQTLKEHEKRYFSYDLELDVMVHALNVWRHYFFGNKFLLMMDHHSLTSYFKQINVNSLQERWNGFLSEFEFDTKHLKGK